MRVKLTAYVTLALVLVTAARVITITNGTPDGNRHPYVGLAIQAIPNLPGFFSICSGSALSERRFLTAAHCFDPSRPVLVTFKSSPPYSLANDFVEGTFHPHPDWCAGCGDGLPGFDTRDVAVIALKRRVSPGAFVTLPGVGLVDTLQSGTSIDLIGYGVNDFARGGGQPQQVTFLTRFFAPSALVQSEHTHSGEFIKLTANPSQGTGGVCFGDSGGPDVISGTNIVVAVNSYVTNGNCSGVTYSNRIDLPEILDFILSI